MANFNILFNNKITTAENLSCTPSPISTLPVTNIQKSSSARIMRVTGTTATITGDFDTLSVISVIGMSNTNLTKEATIEIELYSASGQGGTKVYDSGAIDYASTNTINLGALTWGVSPWGSGEDPVEPTMFVFSEYEALSFKIIITDTTLSNLDIGRVFLGLNINTTYNLTRGGEISLEEKTKQQRTEAGTLRSFNKYEHYKRITFSISVLDEQDRLLLMQQYHICGKHQDILLSVFPEEEGQKETDYRIVGKFVDTPKFKEIAEGYYSTKIIIEET